MDSAKGGSDCFDGQGRVFFPSVQVEAIVLNTNLQKTDPITTIVKGVKDVLECRSN